uniref:Ubiquitin-related modifier 1 n=1 Tax=Podarcis muralis TaxID=64176 RepID=A0A670KKY2_PODMU
MAAPLSLQLEFGGGAELLFDGIRKHQVTLPSQKTPWDVRNLLVWIKENLLKERPELFVQGDSVRPGILVLINDADWELMVCMDSAIWGSCLLGTVFQILLLTIVRVTGSPSTSGREEMVPGFLIFCGRLPQFCNCNEMVLVVFLCFLILCMSCFTPRNVVHRHQNEIKYFVGFLEAFLLLLLLLIIIIIY